MTLGTQTALAPELTERRHGCMRHCRASDKLIKRHIDAGYRKHPAEGLPLAWEYQSIQWIEGKCYKKHVWNGVQIAFLSL